jgi:signal transduction histidine kinase
MLVAGLLIAMCLFAALRAWHHAAARVQELAQANRLLDGEIQAHQRELATRLGAEEQLRGVMRELDLAVQTRTAELATVSGSLSTESALRRQAQETLARSVEDLRQFASFVSHELRQPLASMQIWVKLLGSTYADVLDERGTKYLAEIREAIARMTGLVEAQLRLVHDTTSSGTVDTPVELPLLLEDLLEQLEPQLAQIGGAVQVRELPTVRGDASQLRQLFRNLVENAIKYRRPGEALVVTVRGRAIDGADGAGACEIVVEDNGQGFAPELQDEIFRMFRRASADPSPGSGVGLAICRRIVERHGGTIRAEGRPGVGARFVIVLPADRCDGAEPAADAAAPA